MADLSAQITPAYVHTVSDIFEEVIKNRGTALRNYVSQEALPTPCYKHAIMQYDTGEASRIKNGSEPVKTTPVLTGKRIMMPDSFGNAISLDGYDSRRAKLLDEGLLANKLAESLLEFLHEKRAIMKSACFIIFLPPFDTSVSLFFSAIVSKWCELLRVPLPAYD